MDEKIARDIFQEATYANALLKDIIDGEVPLKLVRVQCKTVERSLENILNVLPYRTNKDERQ